MGHERSTFDGKPPGGQGRPKAIPKRLNGHRPLADPRPHDTRPVRRRERSYTADLEDERSDVAGHRPHHLDGDRKAIRREILEELECEMVLRAQLRGDRSVERREFDRHECAHEPSSSPGNVKRYQVGEAPEWTAWATRRVHTPA